MNKWFGIGRLTKDAELRYTQGTGKAVTKFVIAVDEGFGENKRTNFIPITLWGGENLSKYLTKGTEVAITGSLQLRSYKDKNNVARISTEIIADSFGGVKLIGAKKNIVQDTEELDETCPIDDGDITF